jgi:hypothetical protein
MFTMLPSFVVLCVVIFSSTECVYRYERQDQRDPFVNPLSATPSQPVSRITRPVTAPIRRSVSGVQSLSLADITRLTGVLISPTQRWAFVRGPENRSFTLRLNAKLADGYMVKSITDDPPTVVFSRAGRDRRVTREDE